MSVAQVNAPAPQAAPEFSRTAPPRDNSSLLKIAAALVACGFAPLLFVHFWGLLARPHYQFVALLPVAVWLLVSEREQDAQPDWRGKFLVLIGLAAGLGGLFYATKVWSPWLAMAAAIVALPSVLWMFGGVDHFRRWLPAWVMSWIALPLPFGWDEDLIVWLRTLTTRMSSGVLDQFGIPHQTYGNVVELPLKSLFIADACSGIHSLYVLLGAALFLGLWLRRGWLHLVLLLGATCLLVLIENVSRIVAVVLAFNFQMDLSTGTNHTLLGFVLFVVSLVLLLSFDRLIHFVVSGSEFSLESLLDGRPQELGSVAPLAALVLAFCFVPLGGYQLYAMPTRVTRWENLVEQDIALPEFGAEGLPEKIGQFERTAFDVLKRVHGDPFGQASQQWTYEAGDTLIRVSVDYPYQGIHDLCVCYEQIGWTLDAKQVLQPEQLQALDPSVQAPVSMARLTRNLDGESLLLSSLCDLQGREVAVIKSLARGNEAERAARRFESFDRGANDEVAGADAAPPYLQFHLLARTTEELTPERIDELVRFFITARALLKDKCLSPAP